MLKQLGVGVLCMGMLIGCGGDSSSTSSNGGADAGVSNTWSTNDTGTSGSDDTGTSGGEDTEASDAQDTEASAEAEAIALAEQVDRARLEESLGFVAMPRPAGRNDPHWQAVQDRCAEVFTAAGLEVERHAYGTGVNVIGVRTGTTRADEIVLIGAHYDSVPNCPGADDNASGVAGLFEAARLLGGEDHARTLVLACWDEEELGLVGARHYAARSRMNDEHIVTHYNLESVGYYDETPGSQRLPAGFDVIFPEEVAALEERGSPGDFLATIGDAALNPGASDDLVLIAKAVDLGILALHVPAGLRSSSLAGDLRRSDHAAFWDQGYGGQFMTATANFRNDAYHCPTPDRVDNLSRVNLDFLTKVTATTVGAALLQLDTRDHVPPKPTGDIVPPPQGPACDLTGDDCPDDQRCVLALREGAGELTCVEQAQDPITQGEQCVRGPEGVDDCEEGLMCAFWGEPLGDPQTRTCHPYCKNNEDCGSGSICLAISSFGQGACAAQCDPFDPTACSEETSCVRGVSANQGDIGYICNFTRDGGVPNGPCNHFLECPSNYDCIFLEDGGHCLNRCRVGVDVCDEGTACMPELASGGPENSGHCYAEE